MFILSIVNQIGQFIYAKVTTDDIRDKLLVGMNLYIVDTYYSIISSEIKVFEDYESVVISLRVQKYEKGISETFLEI